MYIPFFIIVARSSKLTSLNLFFFFFTQELFWLYPPRICQKVVRRWIRDTIISFPDLSNNFQCYIFLRSVFWFFILQIQQFSMRDALISYCVVVKVPTNSGWKHKHRNVTFYLSQSLLSHHPFPLSSTILMKFIFVNSELFNLLKITQAY